jgi:hypothetical protein
MSKKTFYTLGRVALAAALVSASSIASAANCSAQYCFVDGTMKLSTSQNFESLEDLLGFSISAPAGSTSAVQIGSIGDQGYVNRIVSSPVTRINFSQSNRVSAAWLDGSSINFTRGTRNVNMRNFSIKLQSAPNIVSINSILQGTEVSTLWNLNGSGTDYVLGDTEAGLILGNGTISTTPSADGHYHAKVTVSALGLRGAYTNDPSHVPRIYGTGPLGIFTSGIGVTGTWISAFDSVAFGSVELDMRFTAVKP